MIKYQKPKLNNHKNTKQRKHEIVLNNNWKLFYLTLGFGISFGIWALAFELNIGFSVFIISYFREISFNRGLNWASLIT